MAHEAGLAGVVLSNHGGRQLDFARSGIEVLVEVTRELKKRNLEVSLLRGSLAVGGPPDSSLLPARDAVRDWDQV